MPGTMFTAANRNATCELSMRGSCDLKIDTGNREKTKGGQQDTKQIGLTTAITPYQSTDDILWPRPKYFRHVDRGRRISS